MIYIVFSYKFQWYIYFLIRWDVKNLNSHQFLQIYSFYHIEGKKN